MFLFSSKRSNALFVLYLNSLVRVEHSILCGISTKTKAFVRGSLMAGVKGTLTDLPPERSAKKNVEVSQLI